MSTTSGNLMYGMQGPGYWIGGNVTPNGYMPFVVENNVGSGNMIGVPNGYADFCMDTGQTSSPTGSLVFRGNVSANSNGPAVYVNGWNFADISQNSINGWAASLSVSNNWGLAIDHTTTGVVSGNHAINEGANSTGAFKFISLGSLTFTSDNVVSGVTNVFSSGSQTPTNYEYPEVSLAAQTIPNLSSQKGQIS